MLVACVATTSSGRCGSGPASPRPNWRARTGTTQSAIARLEAGHGSPTLERLSAIAEACGLDLQVRLVDWDPHDWSLIDRWRRRRTAASKA